MTQWTVEQLQRNVHRITFTGIKSGWEGWIMLRSDAHHDSPDNLADLEAEHLQKAVDRNAAIIDAGDLFDAMGGRYDKRRTQGSTKARHRVDDYTNSILDEAIEFYSPYAKQFAVLGMGNHETSFLKNSGYNLTHGLCRELQRAGGPAHVGGYGGYVLLQFEVGGRIERWAHKYYHGTGGAAPVTRGVIRTNRGAVMFPYADSIQEGHIHRGWTMPLPQEIINSSGTVHKRIQQHIRTPGYKDDYGDGAEGWHVERGGEPSMVGCVWLHLSHKDKRKSGNPRVIRVKPVEDFEVL